MDVRIQDPLELSLPPVTLDWELDFVADELKQALTYWRSRCGERARPTRADISPHAMARFLKHVALIDVRHPAPETRAYRVRLAGTYVEQVFGPISGHRIEDVLPAAIATRWHRSFDAVFEAARPLRLTGRVGFEDKSWLVGEVLLAPLGDELRPVSMILAGFVWQHANKEYAPN
jgi:hypothetical protein